jgi:hypothetical protein
MIRIRSAHPALKPAPGKPGAGQPASPQHFRELEIDHDGRTFTLRIAPTEVLTETVIADWFGIPVLMPLCRNSTLLLVIAG